VGREALRTCQDPRFETRVVVAEALVNARSHFGGSCLCRPCRVFCAGDGPGKGSAQPELRRCRWGASGPRAVSPHDGVSGALSKPRRSHTAVSGGLAADWIRDQRTQRQPQQRLAAGERLLCCHARPAWNRATQCAAVRAERLCRHTQILAYESVWSSRKRRSMRRHDLRGSGLAMSSPVFGAGDGARAGSANRSFVKCRSGARAPSAVSPRVYHFCQRCRDTGIGGAVRRLG
jgi:hypothetical protein